MVSQGGQRRCAKCVGLGRQGQLKLIWRALPPHGTIPANDSRLHESENGKETATMLTSVALAAALTLAPAQGALTLSGARVTYGELGAARPDLKFLPGDIFFVGFDIDGIKVDESGKVQ